MGVRLLSGGNLYDFDIGHALTGSWTLFAVNLNAYRRVCRNFKK